MSQGCYVGRCAGCGSMVCAIVIEPRSKQDDKQWRREVGKFCDDAARRGLMLERVSTEEVRVSLARCSCPDKRKAEAAAQETLAL